ncbi:MAG: GNAT family N-acetyltransferase [Atopobiaceae bacterium]
MHIRACAPKAIHAVEHLAVAQNDSGRILAFMGATGDRLEMLFIDSDMRGQGIGSALLDCGISHWGIRELTVNEQNPLAMEFYERRGFVAYRRTDTDEEGRPFPLVYMCLAER